MKAGLKGVGNYDYVEMFLKDETSQVDRHEVNACVTRASMPSIHELLALTCEFNKSTKVPSRDVTCYRCNKEEAVYCLKVHPDGRTFKNPFCAVLGPKLCQNCSIQGRRQQIISDTKRILDEVDKPVSVRATREQALLTRIRNSHDEEQLYENDVKINYSDLVRGTIARNNTPDIRYLNCRNGRQGDRAENDDKFCVSSLRNTLKRLSSIMQDNNDVGRLQFPDSVDTPIYSRRQSSQKMDHSETSAIYSPPHAKSYSRLTDNPMEPKLNSEQLTQKLSDVFEERYLPPVHNRQLSTSSSASLINYTEKRDLKPADPVKNQQWSGDEEKRNDLCSLSPPLLDIKIQLSRQQMFLRDTLLPDIVPKK